MAKEKLLLHTCCGPCATYPISVLKDKFELVSFFYNPNIYPADETDLRKENALKTADHFNIPFIEAEDDYDFYLGAIKGKEKNVNKERCRECYRLRLLKTAEKAKELEIKNFSTTLLISPYQDIEAIKEIGNVIAGLEGLNFYFEDFRSGYQKSREIAKELNLYRQKYCGCSFSIKEAVASRG